jgi:4-hydroxybenzoate polyprenyltransferase
MIAYFIISLRPRQWTKNLLLFAGLIFSQHLFSPSYLYRSVLGFAIFCGISGTVYIINDVMDLKQDRAHPLKSKRPLASGKLSVVWALILAGLLGGACVWLSFRLSVTFGCMVSFYLFLMTSYSALLKKVVILDVLIIASGFVLRAAAGAEVIGVPISSWLLICTTFLALFLALCKRRHELVLLGENARDHRQILGEYSAYLLDQMISVVTASTVMAYALYTTSKETIDKFNTRNLVFTVPFVLYGVFRYLYLVHKKEMGGSPELVLLKDKGMIINILLYLVSGAVILYWA